MFDILTRNLYKILIEKTTTRLLVRWQWNKNRKKRKSLPPAKFSHFVEKPYYLIVHCKGKTLVARENFEIGQQQAPNFPS